MQKVYQLPPHVHLLCTIFQDIVLRNFMIPRGYAVVYMIHHAQRDPAVFEDPDVFTPQRWKHKYVVV